MFAAITLSALTMAAQHPFMPSTMQPSKIHCPGAIQCVLGCKICADQRKVVDIFENYDPNHPFPIEDPTCLCDAFKCAAYCVNKKCDAHSKKLIEVEGKNALEEWQSENPQCKVDLNSAWQLSGLVPLLVMFAFY